MTRREPIQSMQMNELINESINLYTVPMNVPYMLFSD